MNELEELKKQNEALKKEVEELHRTHKKKLEFQTIKEWDVSKSSNCFSLVVIGASGDLAKKKTFPSLWFLFCLGLIPPNTTIYGYSRSHMSNEDFRKHLSQHFKGWEEKREEFLSKCFYLSGSYSSAEDFAKLSSIIEQNEKENSTRIFYFAIPPSIFVPVATAIKISATCKTGPTRLIIEKPFGRDLDSSNVLSAQLSSLFHEDQIYRIDHYLGKEMVQNLMMLRFANTAFEPLWNRYYVSSVLITFKEDIGTDGRGGYFDEFGIIRDVMQNHLIQIFSLVAMESPVSMNSEDVRDEKVKVLRSTQPIEFNDIIIGQYTTDGNKPGYLDDKTVPKDSITPTFATAILRINNARWKGVPFILKCGKALNERKAEIRIQFHENSTGLYPGAPRNELVIRVQPDEAIYFKFNSKVPGLENKLVQTELDLTYKQRFDERLPDAYERLIYDVFRGDHNLFVRADELEASWKLFTPLLHKIENEKIKPILYPFGSRGPQESDALIYKYGFLHSKDYKWEPKTKK